MAYRGACHRKTRPHRITPYRRIAQIFAARIAVEGGMLRRKMTDGKRLIGRDGLLHDVDRRGFHVIKTAGQFIVFCNQDPIFALR